MSEWTTVGSGNDLPVTSKLIIVKPSRKHQDWAASEKREPVVARLGVNDEGNLCWECTSGINEDIVAGDRWFYIPE